jgi:hypothetical protein
LYRFFCLFLLLVSCAQAEAPLAMPKEFLGYWHPYSQGAAYVGLEIFPDGRMEGRVDDESRELIKSDKYKILAIEDGRVMMAFKSVYSPDFGRENGKDNLGLASPRYGYYILQIKPSSDTSRVFLSVQYHIHYAPKEEDWLKSASWHREWIAQHPLTGLSGDTYARLRTN